MIHQYKLGGYNIVLDVCSGSVMDVDDVAYDIISIFEKMPRDEVIAEITNKYADSADVTENGCWQWLDGKWPWEYMEV